MNPKISIITPSLQSGNYIKDSILSVFKQIKVDIDYTIIDGGSTDKTNELIQPFINQISNYISEPDNGQADAINKGLKLARGNTINWLNADDYYEPEALHKVCRAFEQGVIAVGGRSRIFDESGTKYYSNGTDIYLGNLPKTLGWARIDQPETFFRKEVWDKVGPLNTDLHYVFDREWWIRYLFHFGLKGFKKIPDILVNFRHHADSKTMSKKIEFEKESLHLYAAYASYANMEKNVGLLYEISGTDPSFTIDIPFQAEKDLIRSMINYHFLLLGNTYYANDMKNESDLCLKMINPDYLHKEDRKLLRQLKFRNRLPLSLVHTFRKKS